jgi:hypothetical protein
MTGFPASDVALAAVVTVPAGGEAGNGEGSAAAAAAPAGAASRANEDAAARLPAAVIVALLALVPLSAALGLWLLPGLPARLRLPAIPLSSFRAAGFLAAATLVWIVHRLGALLPAARVAAIELSWLAVGLAVQGAVGTPTVVRRRIWLALALLFAAARVWAAWSPAMLSPRGGRP